MDELHNGTRARSPHLPAPAHAHAHSKRLKGREHVMSAHHGGAAGRRARPQLQVEDDRRGLRARVGIQVVQLEGESLHAGEI